MSERFKVTKFDEPSGKNYKNYGATSAESDAEATGKLLQNSGNHRIYYKDRVYKKVTYKILNVL